MALTATPNVQVDIYRGFNAANPYNPPNRPAAARGVHGLLRPHVRNGRFGFNAIALHWTNVLLLATGTDLRSAYNSQLNTFNAANADTVIVPDYPVPGRCTAFVAVLVQRGGRGTDGDLLTCYLDRCLPAATCPDPTLVGVPCCPNALPPTLHCTVTGEGTMALTWDGTYWKGSMTTATCFAGTLYVRLSCPGGGSGCGNFVVESSTDGVTYLPCSGLGITCACSPFDISGYICNGCAVHVTL